MSLIKYLRPKEGVGGVKKMILRKNTDPCLRHINDGFTKPEYIVTDLRAIYIHTQYKKKIWYTYIQYIHKTELEKVLITMGQACKTTKE